MSDADKTETSTPVFAPKTAFSSTMDYFIPEVIEGEVFYVSKLGEWFDNVAVVVDENDHITAYFGLPFPPPKDDRSAPKPRPVSGARYFLRKIPAFVASVASNFLANLLIVSLGLFWAAYLGYLGKDAEAKALIAVGSSIINLAMAFIGGFATYWIWRRTQRGKSWRTKGSLGIASFVLALWVGHGLWTSHIINYEFARWPELIPSWWPWNR